MKLYIKVTKDGYEHPIAIAESIPLLARQLGISKATVTSAMSKQRKGLYDCYYRVVEVEDE
jgi:hypothetical protein